MQIVIAHVADNDILETFIQFIARQTMWKANSLPAVLTLLLSTSHFATNSIAAELTPCSGPPEKQVGCLHQNLALVNKTLEDVTRELRRQVADHERRIVELEKKQSTPNSAGWSLGCTNGVCAAIDGRGVIRYIDGSTLTHSQSQLPGPVTGPVSTSCALVNNQEQCWAVDAAGRKWRGYARNIGQNWYGPRD